MNEVRSFASLSGSLLARKGGARPAMRPRSFSEASTLDDLGWDDMGDAQEANNDHVPSSIAALTPAPKPTPVTAATAVAEPREEPAPIVQQRVLADRFGGGEPAPARAAKAAPAAEPAAPAPRPAAKRGRTPGTLAAGKKAAFTLRLDGDRHLRLRLASALTGKSSQVLVTAALDAFLESLPEVGALAGQLPARARPGD